MIIVHRFHHTFCGVILLIALVGLLTGCENKAETDGEALALINQYLQLQQAGDLDAAVALYPEEAREQQRALLDSFVAKRGAMKSFKIQSIEPNTVYSGKYYLAIVRVVGAKNEVTEMITVLNRLSDDRTYVVSHASK